VVHEEVSSLDPQRIEILGAAIDVCHLTQAVAAIVERVPSLSESPQGGYVCLANVHMCMEAIDKPEFLLVLRQASLVLADGRPIFWAQRLLGAATATQIRGYDLVLSLCQQMQAQGLRLGLYGGQDQALLEQLKVRLWQQFPDLNIAYAYAPPFRPLTAAEDQQQVAAIKASHIDVLLVGLGCPKQELWMADHQQQISAVMVGVGAAFDFIAGRKNHAPKVLQLLGLEWLFRLLSEPRRLTGRYLKHNPRFMLLFAAQYFRIKRKPK
jgi:N-acetylglucosaminyldiphosphoundecaprenol N-acetyl-beta-D-mannosaminyltransferase